MARICLGCCEIVTGSINENYNGMAIHYGQDWYCGPVVEVANNVVEETVKSVKSERAEKDYLLEISAQQSFAADTPPEKPLRGMVWQSDEELPTGV